MTGQYNDRGNSYNKQDTLTDLLLMLQESPKFRTDISYLTQGMRELLGTEFLGNYCCYTDERKQSSDAATAYTYISYQGLPILVDVGCGEFNTKVFTTGNKQELKGFYINPLPLFIVDQYHASLTSERDALARQQTPKKYLDAYARIVSPRGGKAYTRKCVGDPSENISYEDIHIHDYDDALIQMRGALLHKTFPNGEFATAVKEIKKLKEMDFDTFYTQIWKGRKFLSEERNRLIGCLWHMGVDLVGSGIGSLEAYQSLYDLIQTFDTHKEVFTKSQ